jgi:hypothetical protein
VNPHKGMEHDYAAQVRPESVRRLEAERRVAEAATQLTRYAALLELQAKAIASVRGVGSQWSRLASVVQALRETAAELSASGDVEMSR